MRHRWSVLPILAAALVAAVAVPAGTASASTPTGAAAVGTRVTALDQIVRVTAISGRANRITVNFANGTVVVHDTGDALVPGVGCTGGPSEARCAVAEFFSLVVDANDLDDHIVKGANLDGHLFGGDGSDTITVNQTGTRFNKIFGGPGNDHLEGGPGDDSLDGGLGADLLHGGTGRDGVSYADRTAPVTVDIDNIADDGVAGEGDNVLTSVEGVGGGSGNDVLTGFGTAGGLNGGPGDDVLNGLEGNDTLGGGPGNDILNGGDGDDLAVTSFIGEPVDGTDTFSGGAGSDTVVYARSTAQNISLDGVANDGLPGENDNNLANVENVTGGFGADTITGNASANTLAGGRASDTLIGLDGDDSLFGVDSDDTLRGDNGADTLDGGEGNDNVTGGAGNDFLTGGPGLIGGPDPLTRDMDVLNGSSGNDTVSFAGHTLGVVADNDGTADDGVTGENDNVLSNVENITGSDGDDVLTGNVLGNILRGGNGNDILDVLDGIDGNDTADGMAGQDICVIDDGDAALDCEQ